MPKTLHLSSWIAISGLPLAVLFLCLSTLSASAATPSATVPIVYIGDEIYGVAGPAPVNCVDPTYVNARPTLDTQRANWIAAATSAIPGSVPLGSLIPGPSGTPINAPLVLRQPDGFSITVTPIDLPAAQGLASGSNATGAPSLTTVQINGSPTGCTMQDNAPRPSSAAGGDFYFNQLSNLHGLNGVHFAFSQPVQAFGAFFGDLETSARGTLAFMRLLDANGTLIADVPISSTIGSQGGVAAENAQCSLSNVPGVDVTAQGLLPGCGNGSTRWIGFVSTTPVAQVLVVVGDNDALPGGKGLTEKLSFMGPAVVRTLPPSEVTLTKQAPNSVTAGAPFYYTLVAANTSNTVAAGVVVSDVAPSGVTFNAVTGSGCILASNTTVCQIDTLAAGATATILIQATANITMTITNNAVITATNDSNLGNNTAMATVTPLAAAPINDCAAMPPSSGSPLVINEILYRQLSAAPNDEWVELYTSQFIAGGTQFYVSDNESGSNEFKLALTIPAGGIATGTYLVIHRVAGTDDLDASDGVLQFYNAGGGSTKLNDSGDNITLYQGASSSGVVLDYVAYGSSSAVNGPGSGWSAPNAPAGANGGQSIAAIQNGANTSSGANWVLSGNGGTVNTATPGADNNGKTACDVAITKQGPSTGVVGEPFNYTISVSNTTNVTMTGVVVTDTQPTGLIFNSVTGAGCNLSGGQVACTLGLLQPHAASTILVNATASTAQTITNTAYTNAISDTIPTDNRSALSIPFARLGAIGDFVYYDTNQNGVQNDGETTPINGIPVTLTLPTGNFTTTVTVDGLYQFPNLPPGVYTVTVGSAPGYGRTSLARHIVTLGVNEIYSAADFGFAYQTAAVALTKQGAPLATIGQRFPYTITVTNLQGATPALDVVMTDTQPTGIIFDAVNDLRCGLFAGQVTCNLGDLPPLDVETVVISATAKTDGLWINTAFITTTNPTALINQRAAFTTTVQAPQADLKLLKTLDKRIVHAGDIVTFTLTLINQGPDIATAVQVSDPLPIGMLYQQNHPQQGIYDSSSGIWDVGDIAVGASVHLTLIVKIQ